MPFSRDHRFSLPKVFTLGSALALILGATGCLSVHRELAKEEQHQLTSWKNQHAEAQNKNTAVAELTWDKALTYLRENNEKIRAADLDCLRSTENLRQVQRSLIPLLSAQAGYNRALDGNSSFDPFTFAASIFFDVPGMVGYRLRLEIARLVTVRSGLARELVWREQVVELYRRYQHCASLSAELSEIRKAATTAQQIELFASTLNRRQLALSIELTDAEEQLRSLLGMPAFAFRCIETSLPNLGYETTANRPAPVDMARLPLRLSAVELVGLHARELGIKLEYWPELSIYVSNPAVYRYAGEKDTVWSSNDVYAGANLNWSLDTRGRRASQKRIQTAEAEIRRKALEQESTRLGNRIRNALTSLAETDNRLTALSSESGVSSIDAALAASRRALAAERREFQLVLWFFDDTRWTGVPSLPAKAAP